MYPKESDGTYLILESKLPCKEKSRKIFKIFPKPQYWLDISKFPDRDIIYLNFELNFS